MWKTERFGVEVFECLWALGVGECVGLLSNL